MVEAYFNFRRRPFLAAPQAASYFAGRAIEQARQSLSRCVERQLGVGLLVGPAGTGKSLLCQVLAEQFRRSHRVVLLGDSRLSTRRCLWRSVSLALDIPARGRDEDELRLALTRSIESPNDATAGLVLIVDEAQSLPPRLLEELRSLTNSLRCGQPRAHLVLAGSPSLEEHCAHHKLESLNQRIAARCYLQSFGRQETQEYVRSQLVAAAADGRGDLFDEAALEAVFRATDGVPRLVNQVCELALIQAADMRIPRLSARQIEEAWTEIQQFPPTWTGSHGAGVRTPSMASVSIIDGSIHADEGMADRSMTNHHIADLGTRDAVDGGQVAGAEAASVAANFIEFGALPEDGPVVVAPTSSAAIAKRSDAGGASVASPPVIEAAQQADGPIWEKLFGDGFTETQPVTDHYAALATRESTAIVTANSHLDNGRAMAAPAVAIAAEAAAAGTMNESSVNESSVNESSANESSANESSVNEPSANESSANESSASDLSASDLSAQDLSASDLSAHASPVAALIATMARESSPGLESELISDRMIGLPAEMTAELTTDLTSEVGTDLIADSTGSSVEARWIAAEELPENLSEQLPEQSSEDFADDLPKGFVAGGMVNDGAGVSAHSASGAGLSAEEALIAAMRSLPAVDDPRRWPPGGVLQGGAMPLGASEPTESQPPGSVPDMETALKGMGRQCLLSLPRDDRDLLVVDDEPTRESGRQGDTVSETGGERGRDQGRARRQEYRLLFSRLRRG